MSARGSAKRGTRRTSDAMSEAVGAFRAQHLSLSVAEIATETGPHRVIVNENEKIGRAHV
jgi:hypothetical protein